MPYSDFGGPILNKDSVQKVSRSLLAFIKNLSVEGGIDYAKICLVADGSERFFQHPLGYIDSSAGVTEVDLRSTPARRIWQKIYKNKQRKKFRRYERDGVSIRKATTRSDLITFYKLYYHNLRYIGAKPFPFSFFENMWETLYPENFFVWLLEMENPIGGLAVFTYKDKIYEMYAAIDRFWPSIRRYSVQPYLSWKLLEWADKKGFRYVSQGKTPSSPQDRYYADKTATGASFVQQKSVYIPFHCNTQMFLGGMKQVILLWRTIRNFLPKEMRNKVLTHIKW